MVLASFSDRCRAELMLLLGNMDKYMVRDVVRIINCIKFRSFYHQPCLMQEEEGNTAYVLFWHCSLKPTLRLAIWFDAPRHIVAASVTREIVRHKPEVFQEFYTHILSPYRNVRNILFATPSWPSVACTYEMLIT